MAKTVKEVETIVREWMNKKITLEDACRLTGKSAPRVREYANILFNGGKLLRIMEKRS